MNVMCSECMKRYDDAERSTICPHELIMPAEDLKRKDLALEIIGKYVQFLHESPGSGPRFFVQSCNFIGMVTLEGMVGEFPPHLFRLALGRWVNSPTPSQPEGRLESGHLVSLSVLP